MTAITVEPHQAGSARFEEVPEPGLHDGSVLVEAIAVGVCGTDVEIGDLVVGIVRRPDPAPCPSGHRGRQSRRGVPRPGGRVGTPPERERRRISSPSRARKK